MSYVGNQPISAAFLVDTFSGTGAATAFTMSVAPANTSSVIVAITGVLQDPSTYSVSGTTLTFSAAPPSGTNNISVRYLGIPASGVTTTAYRTVTNNTATAGQTSFTVPSYTVGYIDVYRNGVRLATTDFTASTGTTVVLNNAANAGDTITTESFYVSSVLNAIPATNASVQQTYLASGVAGTGPAFSAYLNSGTQVLTASTNTKISLNTTEFDTASCYNTSTYRFTPNVAGYYLFNGELDGVSAGATYMLPQIAKNGTVVKRGNLLNMASGTEWMATATGLIYMNGTTDYAELYCLVGGANVTIYGGNVTNTYFQGFLARAA